MSSQYPRIIRILNYTLCDQLYRRCHCLIQWSAQTSGIINETFWNPFENFAEDGGSHAEMEEKFKRIFYDLYSSENVRDLWIADFNAALKYRNLNAQPYAFFEKRSVTGTVIAMIHKTNGYPANTWIMGVGSQKVWIRMPWNIKECQPGEAVHIRVNGGHIEFIPVEPPIKVVDVIRKPQQGEVWS